MSELRFSFSAHQSFSKNDFSEMFVLRSMLHLRRSDGNVMSEFAIVLPIFIALVGSIIDWSMVLLSAHVAQNAVREGVRAAVIIPSLDSSDHSAIDNIVRGKLAGADYLANVQVDITGPADLPQEPSSQLMVEVKFEGRYQCFFLGLFGVPSLPVVADATMRYEWQPL